MNCAKSTHNLLELLINISYEEVCFDLEQCSQKGLSWMEMKKDLGQIIRKSRKFMKDLILLHNRITALKKRYGRKDLQFVLPVVFPM